LKKYRTNVAALIISSKGKLLICERSDRDGVWQFPQGGVKRTETLLEGLHREVYEEVGYLESDYSIVEQRGGYRYLYPQGHKKKYEGQEQSYFLLRLKQHASKWDLNILKDPEFQDARWISPHQFQIQWIADFKREVYRRVMKDFFAVNLP